MDGFRAILAILGVVVVGLVYWYTQRENRRRKERDRIEPTFDAPDIGSPDDLPDPLLAEPAIPVDEIAEGDAAIHDQIPLPNQPQPEKIVAVRVVAREEETFNGEDLVLALRGLGLRHGQFGIFHRHDGDEPAPVFSVANLIEPGSFELANIREQVFPGISLFLVLPGQLAGTEAFDMMIETARTIAKSFDGELLDASGSTLSIQRERFMREEIIQFEHNLTLSQNR